jgi:hypothetical protein
VEQQHELLSPEDFQQYMLRQFDLYLNAKKTVSSQDKSKEPAPEENDLFDDFVPPEASWGGLGAVSTFFKTAVAGVTEFAGRKFATHSNVVEFVTKEMAEIIAQPASSLTKMTNLAILFYGLQCHIDKTGSKRLRKLLIDADTVLWAAVPFVDINEELASGITYTIQNYKDMHYKKNPSVNNGNVDHLNLGITISADHISFLNDQYEKSKSADGRAIIRADRILFMMMFVCQIMQAKNLISNCTGMINTAQTASYKSNVSINLNDEKSMLYKLAWRYRCNNRDNMTVWTQGNSPMTYPRLPTSGQGWIPVMRPISSLEDLFDITKPAPCMGQAYGIFLAEFDRRFEFNRGRELANSNYLAK